MTSASDILTLVGWSADSVTNGQAIVDAAVAAYGRLDIVINNAGILTPEAWSDLTIESWQRTLDVNLSGVFSVSQNVAAVSFETYHKHASWSGCYR